MVTAVADGDESSPGRERRGRSAGPKGRAGTALGALLLVTGGLHVLWLVRFRHGYLTEWDEAGYIQIALLDRVGLARGGLRGLVEMVLSQPGQAPLVPLATVASYLIAGEGVFQSLLVIPLFFLWLVAATYALGRILLPRGFALLSALTVAAMPVVTDFARLYHFSVPAAAAMTTCLWALLRSQGLCSRRWAVLAGVSAALMVLSRTMTLAYLPGLALAALALLALEPGSRRRRALNLGLGALAGAALAALWYVPNAGSVSGYLVEAGYGSRSGLYGPSRPILSVSFWTEELELLARQLYLPLVAALALALLSGAAALLARRRLPTGPRSAGLIAVLLVVLEGYAALTSSRNEGTAFSLPWLPALAVVAGAAVAGTPWLLVRRALAALLAVVSLVDVAMKAGFAPPLAAVRLVHLPGLGTVPVTDGTGVIQREVEAAGYSIGRPTEPLPPLHRLWLPFERRVTGFALRYAERRREEPHVVMAVDDLLFNNTRIRLAGALWYRRYVRVGRLEPSGDGRAEYRRSLLARGNNLLVTGESRAGKAGARRARAAVEEAARSLGFRRLRSFRMPDGRVVWVWWRSGGQG